MDKKGKIRNGVEREEDGGIKEGTSSASVVNEKENRNIFRNFIGGNQSPS